MWEIIIGIILIIIIIDIYLRIRSSADEIWYLLLTTDVINKTLANNKIIDRDKINKSIKEVLENAKEISPERYKRASEALKRKGISLN